MGGVVKRWRAALAASILAIATALVAGSCWNPLNWALSTWAHLDMVKVQGGTLTLGNVDGYVAVCGRIACPLRRRSPHS